MPHIIVNHVYEKERNKYSNKKGENLRGSDREIYIDEIYIECICY